MQGQSKWKTEALFFERKKFYGLVTSFISGISSPALVKSYNSTFSVKTKSAALCRQNKVYLVLISKQLQFSASKFPLNIHNKYSRI